MDKISVEVRSRNMSKIRSKDTRPELMLRKNLFHNGLRYRVHTKIKGTPDIVFPGKSTVIFVHGCFWHGHGCKVDHTVKSNSAFWDSKISRNKERDLLNTRALTSEGWNVIIIWECDIRKNSPKIYTNLLRKLGVSSNSVTTISY